MLAVLAAITEILKKQGGSETETEYFAALMSTLEVFILSIEYHTKAVKMFNDGQKRTKSPANIMFYVLRIVKM